MAGTGDSPDPGGIVTLLRARREASWQARRRREAGDDDPFFAGGASLRDDRIASQNDD
jgi:hypothetical protein